MREQKRWEIKPPVPIEVQKELESYDPILQQLLYNRGINDGESAAQFLSGDGPVYDPFLLPDMKQAVERIFKAIELKEKIVVYGDFDVDGITSTSILVQALRQYGGIVDGFIPDRIDDGYGVNVQVIKDLSAQGVKLIITVDCGIRSPDEVAYAQELGVDFIISDHHSAGDHLPPAVAVVNPKRNDSRYPNRYLAGVGVAYKIIEALFTEKQIPGAFPQQWLDLVAVGTVSDIVMLSGENRALVKQGLFRLANHPRQGLFSLAGAAQLDLETVSSADIGFVLGPRLNAAGRLDSAMKAFKLLMEDDPLITGMLAQELDNLNNKRKKITKEIEEGIQIEKSNDFLVFAANPEFEMGVVGLAAARLTEKHHLPAIVGTRNEETTRASCRSIPEFHITHALDECADLLEQHGGHAMAAGFTVRNDHLDELVSRLKTIARRELGGLELQPVLEADLIVQFKDLRPDWITRYITPTEPTGCGNPPVTFVTRAVELKSVRKVGNGNHLRMTVRHPEAKFVVDAIAFNQGDLFEEITSKNNVRFDLMFSYEYNYYRNVASAQMNIIDIKKLG